MISEPLIISASRATDIPAFYSEWLMKRLEEGVVEKRNPFNGKLYKISFSKARVIVFWTKNAEPLMPYLKRISAMGYNYYFQYTINNYEGYGIEPDIPLLKNRLETFIRLSEQIGKEKVIWRFDPLLLYPGIDISKLSERVIELGDLLTGYTDKLVISFADINKYLKVRRKFIKKTGQIKNINISEIELTNKQKQEIAKLLSRACKIWKKRNSTFSISTCAEEIDLEDYGITHNKCIDDELMCKLFGEDKALMKFLKNEISLDSGSNINKVRKLKDNGQRRACNCVMSKDIGMYNTCGYNCIYCYATNH